MTKPTDTMYAVAKVLDTSGPMDHIGVGRHLDMDGTVIASVIKAMIKRNYIWEWDDGIYALTTPLTPTRIMADMD
jgi:hypothetical protein